jgi:hypothetical protein
MEKLMSKTKSGTQRIGVPPSERYRRPKPRWLDHERDGNYAAFDDAGRHLGDFATLRGALRVIPSTSTSQQKETSRD